MIRAAGGAAVRRHRRWRSPATILLNQPRRDAGNRCVVKSIEQTQLATSVGENSPAGLEPQYEIESATPLVSYGAIRVRAEIQ
jgi:hypothetical protein